MDIDWINSSAGLPRDGEEIEFVLDSRTVAMRGTYIRPDFHSHWAEYGVNRVRSWRNLSPKCDLAVAGSDQPASFLVGTQDYGTSPPFFFAGGVPHVA